MNMKIKRFASFLFCLLAIGAGPASAQGTDDGRSPLLIGAWEYVGAVSVDCDTRQPNGPEIRASYMFNQGGTMIMEDTLPIEGPYRTTGPGVWKRENSGEFSYGHMHYSFAPDNTFLGTVKVRSRLRLSTDGNSFTEKGTFDVIAPDGVVWFSGCLEGTATRVIF